MKRNWSPLPGVWQEAFSLAVESYLQRRSAPIGAVLTNAQGAIVSRGGNSISGHRLSHAEMEAFAGAPAELERRQAHLYVTVEPCPMCTGAIRMMQLGNVHFAAKDPAAGSTHLLQSQGFMREVLSVVHEPAIADLEQATVALVVEHRIRTGHSRWQEAWERYQPRAFAVGRHLASAGAHEGWRAASATPAHLYESVSALCAEA